MKFKSLPRSAPAAVSMVLMSAVAAPPAFALPKLNQPGSPLSRYQAEQIAKDPALYGSFLVADSENTSILYVSPSSKKSQSGVFAFAGGQPQCRILQDMFGITFSVPASGYRTAALTPYSPFFDSQFGNNIRLNSLLVHLTDSFDKLKTLQESHRIEYGAYQAASNNYNRVTEELKNAQKAVDDLASAVNAAVAMLATARTPEAMTAARAALEAAEANRDKYLRDYTVRVLTARAAERPAREALNKAEADWKPYEADATQLQNDINSVTAVYRIIQENSLSAYQTSLNTLTQFENKPVGVASASYHVWDNEVNEAQNLVNGGFLGLGFLQAPQIRPLPILQISLATPSLVAVTQSSPSTASSVLPQVSQLTTVHDSTELSTTSSTLSPLQDTGLKTPAGESVRLRFSNYANQGAGTFNAIVTQGAYCTGTSDLKPMHHKFADPKAPDDHILGYQYQPRGGNVLAQSVALNYLYPTRAEPLAVHCSLDLSMFSKYVRDQGSSSFLFWSSSWDNTIRTKVQNNGVSCSIKDSPSWIRAEDQQQYLQGIQDNMERDIMAEYLLDYAKSWTVTSSEQPIRTPDTGHAFQQIGGAMLMVCGGNPYCMVGAVVLKSADELFGQHAGSTSTQDSFTGSIQRDFALDTWLPMTGSSVIDLTVSLQ